MISKKLRAHYFYWEGVILFDWLDVAMGTGIDFFLPSGVKVTNP